MAMTRDELRAVIVTVAAYTDAQGVSGSVLADADVEAIMGAACRFAREAAAAERARIRELAVRSGAVCTSREGASHWFHDLITEPGRPTPGELWQQAGGNRDEYRRLLREHGHILGPGDEGYDPGKPRTLPCGWSPDTARERKGAQP